MQVLNENIIQSNLDFNIKNEKYRKRQEKDKITEHGGPANNLSRCAKIISCIRKPVCLFTIIKYFVCVVKINREKS